MFVWKEKLAAREEITKINSLESSARGSNRRAVGLVPHPIGPTSQRQVAASQKIRYQQLLISIEGKQSTCCLKVHSPMRKSRSALLVFRGRVLGCVYGRKDLQSQILGPMAFLPFHDDLSMPDSIVDTYILPENLALSAGSLFHGEVFQQAKDSSAFETFGFVYRHLFETQVPGCIVLKRANTDDVLAFIYMFAGQIAGIFSFADGWLDCTYAQALELVQGKLATTVCASKLNAANIDAVHDLTFSLTGIERGKLYKEVLRPLDF